MEPITTKRQKSFEASCANCGKVVKKHRSSTAKSRAFYCSRACYFQAKGKGMSLPDQRGPKNPFWKGGLSQVKKTCSRCGKEFMSAAANERTYCSGECAYESFKKRTMVECKFCGKDFETKIGDIERGKTFLCSRECSAKWYSMMYSGENNPNYGESFTDEHKQRLGDAHAGDKNYNWNGGVKIQKGYRWIGNGKRNGRRYDQEHRLIAEKALGRKLKRGEVVHHINGNKLDNRNCNLLICDEGYHHTLHRRMSLLYQQEHFGDATPATEANLSVSQD